MKGDILAKRIDKTQPDKGTEADALEKETVTGTPETNQPSFTFTPLTPAMEETNEVRSVVSSIDARESESGTESEGTILEDTIEYDHEHDATDESDLDESDSIADSDESDETFSAPVLLREGPVTRPERVRQSTDMTEADLDAERAVTGKRPSMREPRKNRSDRSARDVVIESIETSPVGREELYEAQERAIKELELFEKLKRDERKEAEIIIPEGTFNLKEDIQIDLTQDAVKTILVQALNNKYKKEGLQVNPDIDDELYFILFPKENSDYTAKNGFYLSAHAKLCRIPVIKREFIDG